MPPSSLTRPSLPCDSRPTTARGSTASWAARRHGLATVRPVTYSRSLVNARIVIPSYASMTFGVRHPQRVKAENLMKRVLACFEAGALATGCTYTVTEEQGYDQLHCSTALGEAFKEVAEDRYRELGYKVSSGGLTCVISLSTRHGDEPSAGPPRPTLAKSPLLVPPFIRSSTCPTPRPSTFHVRDQLTRPMELTSSRLGDVHGHSSAAVVDRRVPEGGDGARHRRTARRRRRGVPRAREDVVGGADGGAEDARGGHGIGRRNSFLPRSRDYPKR